MLNLNKPRILELECQEATAQEAIAHGTLKDFTTVHAVRIQLGDSVLNQLITRVFRVTKEVAERVNLGSDVCNWDIVHWD